jgi:dolichol-phosphate mannosyltransferase
MKAHPVDVSIVVPLFNEEKVLPELIKRLDALMAGSSLAIQAVLVNDGSSDQTEAMIREIVQANPAHYKGVLLSRNFGHQVAVTAGLDHVDALHAVMVIDGDLQDPPELLEDMYRLLGKGYDVVYAVRKNRKESFLKKLSYDFFYRIINWLTDGMIPRDSGDFAMFTVRVNDEIRRMPEKIRFIRGLRAFVGFRQVGLEYDRKARFSGDSKYSWKALFRLASDGIFNFSDKPLKLIFTAGISVCLLGLAYLGVILYKKYFLNEVIEGFTSTLVLFIFFNGAQLISLGIIAEYISRIYIESKNRPTYVLKEVVQRDF